MHSAMKIALGAMVLVVTQALAETCDREARAQREAMRGQDARAKERAQADLKWCLDAERARYRTADNPVINDGPPPRNQAEIVRQRREAKRERQIREQERRSRLQK